MALDPLATVADLETLLNRTLDATEAARAPGLLLSASAAVREAAGHQVFTRTVDDTVTLPAPVSEWLRLPQQPVESISSVTIDGVEVEDWKFRSGQLYRLGGWGTLPEDLVVTYTYGYATIPTPVVDLVVQLVLAALKKVEDDGMLGIEPGIRQESISEATYAVTYGSDEPVPISVFDLPARTRQWLRSTYGIGAVSVGGIQ